MISIKSEYEIGLMREAGLIVSKTHKYLIPYIKEGISTLELDKLADDYINKLGGTASCKNYEGFPKSICTSINDEVVHGIPSNRKLKNGDIITIDMVVDYKGYKADSAWTYAVGDISMEKKFLMEHTEKALYEGIKKVMPGNRIGDISRSVEKYALDNGLGVVKELTGHGIGREMHEAPDVPNYSRFSNGPVLKPGMVICIEPMLNLGTADIYLLDDDWTVVTRDGLPSAHFEHTILVTEDGYEILTPRL